MSKNVVTIENKSKINFRIKNINGESEVVKPNNAIQIERELAEKLCSIYKNSFSILEDKIKEVESKKKRKKKDE